MERFIFGDEDYWCDLAERGWPAWREPPDRYDVWSYVLGEIDLDEFTRATGINDNAYKAHVEVEDEMTIQQFLYGVECYY